MEELVELELAAHAAAKASGKVAVAHASFDDDGEFVPAVRLFDTEAEAKAFQAGRAREGEA